MVHNQRAINQACDTYLMVLNGLLTNVAALALMLLCCSSLMAQSRSLSRSKIHLGYLSQNDCGCGLSFNQSDLQNGEYLLWTGPTENAPAHIKLNGTEIQLRFVARSKTSARESVGDRTWKTYSSKNVRLRIEYKVTSVCAPDDEQCEATSYRVKMIVRYRGRVRVIRGVGICGC